MATRVLQRDLVGYAGGVNLYEYVGGRAVTSTDPAGSVRVTGWYGALGFAAACWGSCKCVGPLIPICEQIFFRADLEANMILCAESSCLAASATRQKAHVLQPVLMTMGTQIARRIQNEVLAPPAAVPSQLRLLRSPDHWDTGFQSAGGTG